MKLFIDANIYLSYFRRSGESLSSLKELKRLLKQKKLKLLLPAQTRDEYFRNRNGIAEQSRDPLIRETELKLNLPTPFIKDWREAALVRKRVEATRKAYQELLKKYDATVSGEKTPADIFIKQLFAAAEILEEDEDLLRKAHFRYLRGHPPRKNDGSFGDAITWELLLAKTNDDVVVITNDGDFSEMRGGAISFKAFLEREWVSKNKNKKIEFYVSLGEFINAFERREAVKKEVVQTEKSLYGPLGMNSILTYPTTPGVLTEGNPGGAYVARSNAWTLGNNVSYLAGSGIFTPAGNATASYLTGPSVLTIGGNTAFASPVVSRAWIEGAGSSATAANSGAAETGEDFRLLHLQQKRMKYCPYCGKDIEALLSDVPFLGMNKFKCPHCNSQFDPGRAAQP